MILGYFGLKWNNYHTAPGSNKQSPRHRTLDLPFFIHYKHMTSPKTTFPMHKARVCPTSFGANFAEMFVLIYRLGEFPFSVIANRFESYC